MPVVLYSVLIALVLPDDPNAEKEDIMLLLVSIPFLKDSNDSAEDVETSLDASILIA
jgi:hypothetical protein